MNNLYYTFNAKIPRTIKVKTKERRHIIKPIHFLFFMIDIIPNGMPKNPNKPAMKIIFSYIKSPSIKLMIDAIPKIKLTITIYYLAF